MIFRDRDGCELLILLGESGMMLTDGCDKITVFDGAGFVSALQRAVAQAADTDIVSPWSIGASEITRAAK
jgi:hypothetical protein